MLELQQKIKQAGLRVTHPRLTILTLLKQHTEDLTVKQIYQLLHSQKQQLSLATVYRVISDLVDVGLIANPQTHHIEAKFTLPTVSKSQLLHIRCADLTASKQEHFLQSLQAVFKQFQVELMQIEIKESA